MRGTELKPGFDAFYEEYFDYIFNYVYLRIPSLQDSEDIVAEIFIAMWMNWNNVNHEVNIKNLVFTIARNKINDYLRQHYKINFHTAGIDPDEVPIDKIVVEDKRSRKTLSIINKITKQLNPKELKYFILRYKQNFTYKEISSELGITVNNAKVFNNRLVKKIKKLWQI